MQVKTSLFDSDFPDTLIRLSSCCWYFRYWFHDVLLPFCILITPSTFNSRHKSFRSSSYNSLRSPDISAHEFPPHISLRTLFLNAVCLSSFLNTKFQVPNPQTIADVVFHVDAPSTIAVCSFRRHTVVHTLYLKALCLTIAYGLQARGAMVLWCCGVKNNGSAAVAV